MKKQFTMQTFILQTLHTLWWTVDEFYFFGRRHTGSRSWDGRGKCICSEFNLKLGRKSGFIGENEKMGRIFEMQTLPSRIRPDHVNAVWTFDQLPRVLASTWEMPNMQRICSGQNPLAFRQDILETLIAFYVFFYWKTLCYKVSYQMC